MWWISRRQKGKTIQGGKEEKKLALVSGRD